MSQVGEEKQLPEATGEPLRGEQAEPDGVKFVPVAESIRYHRRAQSAEKKAAELTEQLAQARSEAAELSERLSAADAERRLVSKLAGEHTKDLEAAVLVVKARLLQSSKADGEGASVEQVIEQLKADKPYLFAESAGLAVSVHRTAGARERVSAGRAVLAGAAKKAAATGSRADLQEYLKVRRSFV